MKKTKQAYFSQMSAVIVTALVASGCASGPSKALSVAIYSIAPEPIYWVEVNTKNPSPREREALAGKYTLMPHVSGTYNLYEEALPEKVDVLWNYGVPAARSAVLQVAGRVPEEVLMGGSVVFLFDGEAVHLGWLSRCTGGAPSIRADDCVRGGVLADPDYADAIPGYAPPLVPSEDWPPRPDKVR